LNDTHQRSISSQVPGLPSHPMSQRLAVNQDILTAAKGGGIIFFGRLFEYGSRFLFGILVARVLGAEGFGLYSLAVSMAILLAGIAMLGLPSGVVRFLPIALRDRDAARVWGTLQSALGLAGLVGLGLAIVVFGLADLLAENLLHNPEAASVLKWISITIPLTAVGRVLLASTRGFKQMQYQVYADSIAFNVSKIGLTVVFLSIGFGVAGALAAHATAWILEVILLLFFLNRLFPLKRSLRSARRNTRQLLSFSLPLWLTRLITELGGNLELLILGALTTAAAMGVYSAVLRIQLIGIMFLAAFQEASMPIFSDLYHRGDRSQLSQLYQTLTRWSLFFIIPFFLSLLLFADPILAIFGEEFRTGASAVVIVGVGMLVNAGTGTCGAMIPMSGHSKLSFVNSLFSLVIVLALDLILIPRWGVSGAALASALAIASINIARLLQVYWLHRLWPYNRTFIKPTIAGTAAFFVGLIVSQLMQAESNLIFLFVSIAAIYATFVGTIALLGLSDEDRVMLSSTRKRLNAALIRH
jgi:O-antigen/teichoic acid export membrane protein